MIRLYHLIVDYQSAVAVAAATGSVAVLLALHYYYCLKTVANCSTVAAVVAVVVAV